LAEISFTSNKIPQNANRMGVKLLGELFALATFTASKMQSEARSNAPWNDQTGNARQGLMAKSYRSYAADLSGGRIVVGAVLYHTVPYGIFLETRFSGKYRVIMPTVLRNAGQMMAGARGIIGRA
jgi:hypothetical protein